MNQNYIFSCESTADLPYDYLKERNVEIIFYSYLINGTLYEDNMGRSKEASDKFYQLIDEGHLPSTSQINKYQYLDYFEKLIKNSDNVLHIAFSSGLTPSINNAKEAAKELMEENPNKNIIVIDTKCGASGYGLLMDYVLDMRDKGESIENIIKWINENSNKVHHHFFSTDLRLFRRSGRVSNLSAFVGTILGICPIMHLNKSGKIIAHAKARGKRGAANMILNQMKEHAQNDLEYDGKCYISHANFLEEALFLKSKIESEFKNIKEIQIHEIGNIIGSHCGPGTIALFFMGDEREQ